MLKRHFLSNFICATNTTLNYPFLFLFCFVLITKKRQVQATEHASAEPENGAEARHTVPGTLFYTSPNGHNATHWMAAVQPTCAPATANSCRTPD